VELLLLKERSIHGHEKQVQSKQRKNVAFDFPALHPW